MKNSSSYSGEFWPGLLGAQEDGLLHTTCGTPNYVAPEVINDKGYHGATADLWSCGVILFVLMAGYLPFDEANLMTLYKKVRISPINSSIAFLPVVNKSQGECKHWMIEDTILGIQNADTLFLVLADISGGVYLSFLVFIWCSEVDLQDTGP